MRRPHLSTGAWIFTTAVTVAAITAPSVYAAATSRVAVGNTTNGYTATVNPERQLMTATVAPTQVLHVAGSTASASCHAIYTPPAGQAIVVTSVTYDIGSSTEGTEDTGYLTDTTCSAFYDIADTVHKYDTQRQTFPIGLPMPSIGIYQFTSGLLRVYITGYLIPSTQLPPASAKQAPLPARHVVH